MVEGRDSPPSSVASCNKSRSDSTCSATSSKQQHHVMFQIQEEIVKVETPCDEEIKQRWYSQGEYFFIKKDAMNTVRRLGSCKSLKDDESISSRGLEIVDNELVKEREARIKKAVSTVLKKQRSLTEDSSIDDGSASTGRHFRASAATIEIAKEYHEISTSAEFSAIKKASIDQKESEEYLEDTKRQWKKAERRNRGPTKLLRRLMKWK